MAGPTIRQWSGMNPDEKRGEIWRTLTKMAVIMEPKMPQGAYQRIALTVFNATKKDPKILECTFESIVGSILNAMDLGLEVNTPLQHAYLVPLKGVCHLWIGYRGMILLFRSLSDVSYIETHPVFEHDQFSLEYGTNPKIIHVPVLDATRGNMRLVYAVARFVDGHDPLFEHAILDEIMQAKSASKNPTGAWTAWESQMARKFVLKRIGNYLPVNPRLARAIDLDNNQEAGEVVAIPANLKEVADEVIPEPEEQSSTARIKNELKGKFQVPPAGSGSKEPVTIPVDEPDQGQSELEV